MVYMKIRLGRMMFVYNNVSFIDQFICDYSIANILLIKNPYIRRLLISQYNISQSYIINSAKILNPLFFNLRFAKCSKLTTYIIFN